MITAMYRETGNSCVLVCLKPSTLYQAYLIIIMMIMYSPWKVVWRESLTTGQSPMSQNTKTHLIYASNEFEVQNNHADQEFLSEQIILSCVHL